MLKHHEENEDYEENIMWTCEILFYNIFKLKFKETRNFCRKIIY